MRSICPSLVLLLALGCGAAQQPDDSASLIRETREQRARRARSDETVERYRQAEAAFQAGDWTRAVAMYTRLADETRDAVEPRLRLALMAQRQHQFGEAERWLREVLAIEPERMDTRYALISALLRQRRVADASREFQATRQYGSGDEATELRLKGAIALQAGHLDEATAIYDTLIAADRNDAAGHVGLGVVRAVAGDYDGAVAELTVAARLAPKSYVPHYDLALVYYRAGKLEPAVAEGRLAVQLDPYSMAARNNLAGTLVQLGRMDEARKELEEAIRLRADYAPAHNNLGVLLLTGGDNAGARRELELAIHHAPRAATFRFNLGIALYRAGDLDGARSQFEQVLKIDPRHLDAPRNLRWLDGIRAGTTTGGDLPSVSSRFAVDEFQE